MDDYELDRPDNWGSAASLVAFSGVIDCMVCVLGLRFGGCSNTPELGNRQAVHFAAQV